MQWKGPFGTVLDRRTSALGMSLADYRRELVSDGLIEAGM